MSQGTGVGSCPHPRYPLPLHLSPHLTAPHGLSLASCPGYHHVHIPLPPSVSRPQAGAHPNPLPTGFLERNGKPYCHQDFLALFAPKCRGCERPVTDNYLSALEGRLAH